MARVMLHGAYRELAGGLREIAVGAGDVRSVLVDVVRACPQLAERLRDEHGRLREHLRLFVNGNEVEDLLGGHRARRSLNVVTRGCRAPSASPRRSIPATGRRRS